MKNKLNFKLLNTLLAVVIIYILVTTYNVWGAFLGKVLTILSPFIFGFVLAYALYPFVRMLQNKGVRKPLAVAIVVLVFLLLTVGLLIITMPLLYQQLVALSKQLIEVFSDLSMKFNIELGGFEESIITVLNKTITNAGEYLSNGLVSVISNSIKAIIAVFIVIILFVYFLMDMDKIRKAIKEFFQGFTKKTYNYIKSLDIELGHYFKGLAICIIIQFIEYSILFLIIGHPNWLLLGAIGAVTAIIPYFGQLFTDVVAIVTASVVSTPVFIATIIISLIFPSIDSYIISPKVYGKTNNINPILIILGVIIGNSIGGIIGIVSALPVLIIITTTYRYYKDDIKKQIKKLEHSKEN